MMFKELLSLSFTSQIVVITIISSICYIVFSFLRVILGPIISPVYSVLYHLLSRASTRTKQPITASPTSQQPPRQKAGAGSIKSLLQKSKTSASTASKDHHNSHELFLEGLKGHTDDILGLAFSKDGSAIATVAADRIVRIFSFKPGKTSPSRQIELRKGVTDIAFCGSSSSLVAVQTQGLAGSAGLGAIDVSIAHHQQPDKLPGDVFLWEKENIHKNRLPGMCLLGGGDFLVSSTTATDIHVFSCHNGAEVGSIDHGGLTTHAVAVSQDGTFFAAATFTSDVKVYRIIQDKKTGSVQGVKKAMQLSGHKSKVLAVAFSTDSKSMVTASADGTLKIWNIGVRYLEQEDPKLILTFFPALQPGQQYEGLAWGPGGVIAAVKGTTLHFIDAKTGSIMESVNKAHDKAITAMKWAPEKRDGVAVLATGGEDHRVRMWRAPS